MLTVNYTYGIISGGCVPPESLWYRGVYGPITRNKTQEAALSALWFNRDTNTIGAGTELIINLLRCSEYWPTYISRYDAINTYENRLSPSPDTPRASVAYPELLDWVKRADIPTLPEYTAKSSSIEILVSKLFSLLTIKDG